MERKKLIHNQAWETSAEAWNSAVREPDLAISVIRPIQNLRFYYMGRQNWSKLDNKIKLVSIPGVDPIRDRRTF